MIIRLTVYESKKYNKVEIIINCPEVDHQLGRLIDQINQMGITLTGTKDDKIYSLVPEHVYYIESIDNQTFIYEEKEVYRSQMKLYEFEQLVKDTPFTRISKNLIVNTTHIASVRALLNGKFEASLSNDEKVIVNRHYVKTFRKKFLS
ncbi:LytTR family DNA-binding domain-containing protein [Sporosarcina soli]|uniref:LytTR family DNA-binding domain-containing protein n=1 Tax=Sporosarcina soli TaxID=334736 RepID=UPI0036D39CFA